MCILNKIGDKNNLVYSRTIDACRNWCNRHFTLGDPLGPYALPVGGFTI